jgi:hypothetical protein
MKFTDQIELKNPVGFENLIKNFFENILGFKNIETTEVKGDYGADLIGHFDIKKYVIQVKLYSSSVNLKAVQEVYAAMSYYGADSCCVVTNNTFTESATNLAKSTNCILIDGDDLNRLFSEKYQSFDEKVNYLQQSKIRFFKISNAQLIRAYHKLKSQLNKQPTVEEIDSLCAYSSSSYKKRWGRWNLFLREIGEPPMVDRDITKDDLILNFSDIFSQQKKVPTASDIDKAGKYSISTYTRHFGSWNKFLETQGVKLTKRHLIPKEEFISEYKRVKAKIGRVPTKSEFDKTSNISSNSFKRIWGSWTGFLKDQCEKDHDTSDEELIKEYFKLKQYLEKNSLTQTDMNKKGKFSSSTYERRFGSWNKFLNKIGEEQNVKTNISKEDLLKDYMRIKLEIGKDDLSASDIKKYSAFSLSTFFKKFGSWSNCKTKVAEMTSNLD